jgi:hypothetical protein
MECPDNPGVWTITVTVKGKDKEFCTQCKNYHEPERRSDGSEPVQSVLRKGWAGV